MINDPIHGMHKSEGRKRRDRERASKVDLHGEKIWPKGVRLEAGRVARNRRDLDARAWRAAWFGHLGGFRHHAKAGSLAHS